jgi:hypothetical protein
VGFLNPAVYALCRGTNYGAAFHDIVLGNNTNFVSQTNYPAVPGYDLCTGWGTPAGTNLINALAIPDPLGILPSSIFAASGLLGGPFTATNWIVTLTNAGPGNLNWALGAGIPAWLSVPATGGMIGSHGFTNFTLQLVQAGALPAGSYGCLLTFTNLALSRVQNVSVQVDVGLTVANNIVQNGGFETGDFSDWTLVGQTVSMNQACNIVATDADFPGLVHSGTFGAFLGQQGYPAVLSQVLTTTPGHAYLVSFWLDSLTAGDFQQFSAVWSGTNLTTLIDPVPFAWSNFLFAVTAADTNATLEFDVENDPSYFGFDDVSVTPLPPVNFSGYSVSTNGVLLVWPSLSGLTYTVQCTADLTSGVWTNLADMSAVSNLTSFLDTNNCLSVSNLFYRLALPP